MKLHWHVREPSGEASIGLYDNCMVFTVRPYDVESRDFGWIVELAHEKISLYNNLYDTREQAMEAVEAWLLNETKKTVKELEK